MTELPVADKERRKGGREEGRKIWPSSFALPMIDCGHCINSLISLSITFFISEMEIICNCVLVSYVKSAAGYVNSGGYFASNLIMTIIIT